MQTTLIALGQRWGVKYKHISWFIFSPYFYSMKEEWWANGR